MGEIKISPSSYKDLNRPDVCPKKWHAEWVTKEIEFKSSEAMDKGSFFEYLCIGGGAKADDNITELPLTKAGKKTADQERIEQQAEVFKELFNPESEHYLGWDIVDVQKRLENEHFKGYYDIKAVNSTTGELAHIDLKLTAKIKGYGDYDWSDVTKTDTIQLPLYKLTDTDKIDKLFYLVFDYSPEMNILFREVELTEDGEDIIREQLMNAYEIANLYEKNGWVTDPSLNECKDCPLQCKDRFQTSKILKDKFVI